MSVLQQIWDFALSSEWNKYMLTSNVFGLRTNDQYALLLMAKDHSKIIEEPTLQ